jgi:hypothetical protein
MDANHFIVMFLILLLPEGVLKNLLVDPGSKVLLTIHAGGFMMGCVKVQKHNRESRSSRERSRRCNRERNPKMPLSVTSRVGKVRKVGRSGSQKTCLDKIAGVDFAERQNPAKSALGYRNWVTPFKVILEGRFLMEPQAAFFGQVKQAPDIFLSIPGVLHPADGDQSTGVCLFTNPEYGKGVRHEKKYWSFGSYSAGCFYLYNNPCGASRDTRAEQ